MAGLVSEPEHPYRIIALSLTLVLRFRHFLPSSGKTRGAVGSQDTFVALGDLLSLRTYLSRRTRACAQTRRGPSISSSMATAAFPATPFAPACSPRQATFMTRQRWNAISIPCGTPATSMTCASRREPSTKGWIIHVYVKEKPTIREIKYTGLSSVIAERRSRQIQGTESRTDAGEPVRSDQGEARRGRDQAIARRARPPVRHRPSEVRPIPPAAVALDLRGEGRPQGQGRQDQLRRQQGDHQRANCRAR